MRLSQLARKLEMSPSELIIFFEKNKIKRYSSHNNKIEEGDLKLALNYFSAVEMEADVDAHIHQGHESVKDTLPEPSQETDSEIPLNKVSESATDKKEIEVISMPKIKLEGVKVVGKIDLPEPVKKVDDDIKPEAEDQNKFSDNISQVEHRKENYKTKKRTLRQRHKHKRAIKELSYDEKLKREERKKTQEQQKAKKLKKEQKKQHYIKNVQSNISPKRKKKNSRKTSDMETEPIKIRPEYKNPVRKFWAWLNGEYD